MLSTLAKGAWHGAAQGKKGKKIRSSANSEWINLKIGTNIIQYIS